MKRSGAILVVFCLALVQSREILRRPRLDGRIVGGEKVDITDYPFQVSLQLGTNHMCGGSIINERFVLTAAHCTDGNTADRLNIRLGSSKYAEGGEVFQVARIHQHANYSYYNIDFDYSILELAETITFDETKQPVKLPEQNFEVEDGTQLLVSGWGNTKNSSQPRDVLRAATVPKVNHQECSKAYSAYGGITDQMMCAGLQKGGKDACQGDSGGPLVIKETKELVGVVSWGYGCAEPQFPGVYSKVSAVVDWINEIVN